MTGPVHVAVVGAGRPGDAEADAETIGRLVAQAGATLVCGGLGGVMEAACRGARSAGGRTVGILPGTDRGAANAYVDVAIHVVATPEDAVSAAIRLAGEHRT